MHQETKNNCLILINLYLMPIDICLIRQDNASYWKIQYLDQMSANYSHGSIILGRT